MIHVDTAIDALLDSLNNPSLPWIDLSLDRVKLLLAKLGNPEKKLPPVIHIAGTNGKGSTLAFLRAIYQAAGYKVHAYTSPHLVRFNERIVIANHEISDDGLLDMLQRVVAAEQPVTYFEATTAAAFLAFSEHAADVLLLETGLGGRKDATNVVEKPIATVITPIDYDHMEFLGTTLTEIAGEKAAIMKRGAPCFTGAQKAESREVLKRTARETGCDIHLYERDWNYEVTATGLRVLCGAQTWKLPKPSLLGEHQHHNAALASVVAAALQQLPVADEALAKGIANAHWPARLQQLTEGPLVEAWGARGVVMLDGGHNPSAALTLRQWIESQKEPVTLLLGMMRRKDAMTFLKMLGDKLAGIITTPIPQNDSYTADELAVMAREAGIRNVRSAASFTDVPAMMGNSSGILLISGSLFLAGEVLKNHS